MVEKKSTPKVAGARTEEDSSATTTPASAEERERLTRALITPSPEGQAVGSTSEPDSIVLASAEYKSKKTRKSLTVYHIQRRLQELGFHDAAADQSSYYGDLTLKSVREFQEKHNVGSRDGFMDAETFSLLFALDGNVRITL